MTKNNAMRLGSVMLVLALLSTCALWGTFAKYVVTSNTTTDSAHVAKWGVSLEAPTDTTFLDSYSKDSTASGLDSIENTVITATTRDSVIAPGTTNKVAVAKAKGTAEVATELSYTVDTCSLEGFLISYTDTSDTAHKDELYFPVKFSIDDSDVTVDLDGVNTVADAATKVKEALQNALDAKKVVSAANTELSNVSQPSISWRWTFGDTDADKTDTNIKDTALGTASNAGTVKIELGISTKVTQID